MDEYVRLQEDREKRCMYKLEDNIKENNKFNTLRWQV